MRGGLVYCEVTKSSKIFTSDVINMNLGGGTRSRGHLISLSLLYSPTILWRRTNVVTFSNWGFRGLIPHLRRFEYTLVRSTWSDQRPSASAEQNLVEHCLRMGTRMFFEWRIIDYSLDMQDITYVSSRLIQSSPRLYQLVLPKITNPNTWFS
jgi:hypothetical protein